jgi:hypothetical protein
MAAHVADINVSHGMPQSATLATAMSGSADERIGVAHGA